MSVVLNVGRIDEKGYLAGMERRGYSEPKCLLELVANSLDALDSVMHERGFTPAIAYKVERESILQMDNGAGMDADNIGNMFAMHRENHSSEASRGVSGIGAKPALSILSRKSVVNIYTRKREGSFLKVTAPWDAIHAAGKYTGMVVVTPMTEEEQTEFFRQREESGMLNGGIAHGTTIRFKYSDELAYLLRANFLPISHEDALKDPLDRIGIVFGHDDVRMTLDDYTQPDETLEIEKYNYFGVPDAEFYTGKSEHIIEHIQSERENKDRFILRTPEGSLEIRVNGRGMSKNPETVTEGRIGYRPVGTFRVVCGMRLDRELFDPDAPREMGADAFAGEYSERALGGGGIGGNKLQEPFLCCYKLIRNNQAIGLIDPPDTSMSSARGTSDSRLELMHVQAELRFNPVSAQDNRQDLVTGIQENKNQFNGSNVPKQLTRIVAYLRKMKANEIRGFMEACRRRAQPPPPPVSDDEEEEEEEESHHGDTNSAESDASGDAAGDAESDDSLPPLEPLPQEPLPQEPLPQEPLPQEPLPQEPLPQEPPQPQLPPSITGAELMSLIHTKILPTERYTEQQLRDMFDQILNESNVNLIL
jgi:hypothetical protein